MMDRLSVIGLMLLMLAGCGHQAPQRPSQRKGEAPQADSSAIALLEMNQQLAMTADQQLLQFVQTQEESYALYEANTWLTVLDRPDDSGAQPMPNEEWIIHMRTYNLAGQLLEDSEGTYRIGKQELPMAVDANIGELHRGDKARLIAPWYAAYGLKGTEHIPPYENVIIEIELK